MYIKIKERLFTEVKNSNKEDVTMTELLYFNPKKNNSTTDHVIFKLLPKNEEEGWKVNEAERLLEPMQLLYYYGYIIVYGVLHFLPQEHQENIMNLVNAGILDDIIAYYAPDLTDSYVTKNKFFYKQKEFTLPKGYSPRMRYIDENGYILVDSIDSKGRTRVFRFITEENKDLRSYRWEVWRDHEEKN